MIELFLKRQGEEGGAMLGLLNGGPLKQTIFTLEDAWRGNEHGDSCVPDGRYECEPWGWEEGAWQKFRKVWHLKSVPGRDAILIHAGNTHLDTHGCILVGLGKSKNTITQSRAAVELLRSTIGNQGFYLTIE